MSLSRRRRLVFALTLWTLGVSLARAIRLPNDFAEAHWLLDYRFGLIKRGLVGSVASVVARVTGFPMTPRVIVFYSALVFSLFLATLCVVAVRMLRRHSFDPDTIFIVLVFASSPFVVMSAHLFGYLDALLYALCILSILCVLRGRLWMATALSIVAMLVHESYLLLGYPLVVLAAMLTCSPDRSGDQPSESTPWRAWLRLWPLSLPMVAFLLLELVPILRDQHLLRAQLTNRLSQYDFIGSKCYDISAWETSGLLEKLHTQLSLAPLRLVKTDVLEFVAPSAILFLVYALDTFGIRLLSRLSVVLAIVIHFPLIIHAVAWDSERIASYVVASAFLSTWVLCETRARRCNDGVLLPLGAVVLVLNVFGRLSLMDGEVDRFSAVERALLYAPPLLYASTLLFQRYKAGRAPVDSG